MIKKAARIAAGIAAGTAFGFCILPRVILQWQYGATWPPVWKEALLYFATGFIAAFSVLVLIYRIKGSRNQGNRSLNQHDRPGMMQNRTVFDSKLPADIDWDEVNAFLTATGFSGQLLWDNWRQSDAFAIYPVSDASIGCLQCLHEDLLSCCVGGPFAFDEEGREDRGEEYRILWANLSTKYSGIEEKTLKEIYYNYLKEDR